MKNILGTQKDLELFNKASQRVYCYYKDSTGYSYEETYDERGNKLTFKNSEGHIWESTYDERGNELTFKNSNGVTQGFGIPEYTMEELVAKLGNFKIKK